MSQPSQPAFRPPDELEAFAVLVLRYLDGGCSAEEIRQLKEALVGGAESRELFVQVCRMYGGLHEAYAPRREKRRRRAKSGVATTSTPATDRPAPPGDGNPAVRPDHPEQTGDVRTGPELPADAEPRDAGAETVIRKPAGEDTAFPPPEATEQ